jgi:hypothetical protein
VLFVMPVFGLDGRVGFVVGSRGQWSRKECYAKPQYLGPFPLPSVSLTGL